MKTAVEQLADNLPFELKFLLMTEIEQAKEMEKQQIMAAWNNRAGFSEGGFLVYTDNRIAEDYYNETFKSE
jgi:hypothetical protein